MIHKIDHGNHLRTKQKGQMLNFMHSLYYVQNERIIKNVISIRDLRVSRGWLWGPSSGMWRRVVLVTYDTFKSIYTKFSTSDLRSSRNLNFLDRFSKRKKADIKFHQNPYSGGQVVPCGWTDGRTHMTKLVVAFRNFAKAPKKPNSYFCTWKCLFWVPHKTHKCHTWAESKIFYCRTLVMI